MTDFTEFFLCRIHVHNCLKPGSKHMKEVVHHWMPASKVSRTCKNHNDFNEQNSLAL